MKNKKRILIKSPYTLAFLISVTAWIVMLYGVMYVTIPDAEVPQINFPKKITIEWDACGLDSVVCPEELSAEDQVAQKITKIANEYSFNADELIHLAVCESNLDPKKWNTTTCPSCRGLYQWHKNSLADDDCALDIECSTIETIKALQRGEDWRWPNC